MAGGNVDPDEASPDCGNRPLAPDSHGGGAGNVQEVSTWQSIAGQVFDYGHLEIYCFGPGISKHFGPVAHPDDLRDHIFAAKSLLMDSIQAGL